MKTKVSIQNHKISLGALFTQSPLKGRQIITISKEAFDMPGSAGTRTESNQADRKQLIR